MKKPTTNPILQRTSEKWTAGKRQASNLVVPTEVPIAFEYNCVSHAVMLATPEDLEDFAIGFSLSEGIIKNADEIIGLHPKQHSDGIILEMEIPKEQMELLEQHQRKFIAGSGCGLCGKDSIEAVMRPLPKIGSGLIIKSQAIQNAYKTMRDYQPLNNACSALHGAAFVDLDGNIIALREDIGRHNALDKLIGHINRAGIDPTQGFALMSSRCSYELVHKSVTAGLPCLATVSAPSQMAIDIAKDSNTSLVVLVRDDTMHIVCDDAGRISG